MSVWKSEDMSTYLKNKLLRRTGGMDLPPTGRQQRSRSLDVEALQRSGVQVILQVIIVYNDKTLSSLPVSQIIEIILDLHCALYIMLTQWFPTLFPPYTSFQEPHSPYEISTNSMRISGVRFEKVQ